jgi:hypothetical protein
LGYLRGHPQSGEQLNAKMLSNSLLSKPCDKFLRRCGDCKHAFTSNTPRNVRQAATFYDAAQTETLETSHISLEVGRRQALAAVVTVPAILQANAALAVQGLTAGRIPGELMHLLRPCCTNVANQVVKLAVACHGLGLRRQVAVW